MTDVADHIVVEPNPLQISKRGEWTDIVDLVVAKPELSQVGKRGQGTDITNHIFE